MKVSVASDLAKMPSNSPYGAFTNIHLPFSSEEKMRRQFSLLNLNKLRLGKIIEMLDHFAVDTALNYTKDFTKEQSCFVTAVVDGLTQKKQLSSEKDVGINCYPISAGNSSLHVRTDVYQETSDSSSGLTV
jgi:acyl-CoA hydrolase